MTKVFILVSIYISIAFSDVEGQNDEMGGFNQLIDLSNLEGVQYRLSVYAKIETYNIHGSIARVFVTVSNADGTSSNNYEQLTSDDWKEYSIEGSIKPGCTQLILGGYFYGIGKYYFDKFQIRIRDKNGVWQPVDVGNSGFESENLDNSKPTEGIFNKWIFSRNDGFQYSLINSKEVEGKQALLVDGSPKARFGNFTHVNGIRIYYEFHGQGSDTILLLHGNGQSVKSFRDQIPTFSRLFTVLAMDSRAQGYSSDDGKELTYELMAEDVTLLLNSLKIARINILGWSDGGNIALILAMQNPSKVERLAIMGANLFCDTTSVDRKITDQLKQTQNDLEGKNTPNTNYQLRMIRLLLNEPKIDPDDLRSITCKTLIMAGSKDIIKKEHTILIANHIKNSQLVIFKDGTHFEPQQNPKRFNKTVISFFKEGTR